MVRWMLRADGVLSLDYSYRLTGRFLYHGITFDAPLSTIRAVRGLIEGPMPAWQNRRCGTVLGVHEIAARDITGLPTPDHAGYFGGVRWARLTTADGDWVVTSDTPDVLRLGTRLDDFPATTVDFSARRRIFSEGDAGDGIEIYHARGLGAERPAD